MLTTAVVKEGTAGSPQPFPISAGELFKWPKGRAGKDGVQPRGTEAVGSRSWSWQRGTGPFTYALWLTDLARRWLQPEIRWVAGVVEQVRPGTVSGGAAMAAWVRCHQPSSLEAAVTLDEDHLVQCPGHMQGGETGAGATVEGFPLVWGPVASPRGPGRVPPGISPCSFPPVPRSVTECWRCGQLGHFLHECPLMEEGQVVQVVGPTYLCS